MAVHNNIKDFECNKCTFSASQKDLVANHIKDIHNTNILLKLKSIAKSTAANQTTDEIQPERISRQPHKR